ncbi:MAG: alanine--glyoxylate aminotransferase family protein [Thaumarchaeota archaeon]|nr:alanine--glyoxylate aminotransferase family protein [Nitrososphaerota archaeon]
MEERLLMVPGPTNLSTRVREALSQPQVGHTDPDFAQNFSETLRLARRVFRNNAGYQFVLTGTGTVGMEAAVAATVQPGDRVLILNTGYFGQRMADINRCYGAEVEELNFGFGVHADPDSVRKRLAAGGKFKALYVTQVDTGTTVCNPVDEIVEEAKNAGVMALVDGVCSVGGIELDFDGMGADLAFTGSQKALAAPPGAVLIAVSMPFLEQLEAKRGKIRAYYSDLLRWKAVMDDPRTYFATPAVQLMQALHEALQEVEDEGLEQRWERHKKNARIIRDGIEGVGAKLVVEEGHRADTVTGLWTSPGAAPEIQKYLRDKHRIDVARGLGENNTKMLRVGHFGNLSEQQASFFVDSFREAVGSASKL